MAEAIKMFSLKLIISLLVVILIFHAVAIINYWYWTFSWLDIPMHFFGGFWVAMFFVWLYHSKISQLSNYLIAFLITLSFVALIGIFWEFLEFFYDVFISSKGYSGYMQLSAADTIADLFFDLAGGSVLLGIYFFKSKKFKNNVENL